MSDFIGVYQMDRGTASGVGRLFDTLSSLASRGTFASYASGTQVNRDVKESMDLRVDGFVAGHPAVVSYLTALRSCLREYCSQYEYAAIDHAAWAIEEAPLIQRYPPGGGFKTFHYEKNGSPEYALRRHLVFMTYLTDIPPELGGGTEFLYQERTFSCELGKTLIWPAEWTHTHRGQISEVAEKTIITGWYSYISK